MKITKIESSRIVLHDDSEVKVKTSGKSILVQFLAGQNKECQVQNLSKEEYLDKATGEVRQKNHRDSRFHSPKSVRRSINTLMDLIRLQRYGDEPLQVDYVDLSSCDDRP